MQVASCKRGGCVSLILMEPTPSLNLSTLVKFYVSDIDNEILLYEFIEI